MTSVQAFYVRYDLFESDCPGTWEFVQNTMERFGIESDVYEFASAIVDVHEGKYTIYLNHVTLEAGLTLELERATESFILSKLELLYEPSI
jgi:hypothetical protein